MKWPQRGRQPQIIWPELIWPELFLFCLSPLIRGEWSSVVCAEAEIQTNKKWIRTVFIGHLVLFPSFYGTPCTISWCYVGTNLVIIFQTAAPPPHTSTNLHNCQGEKNIWREISYFVKNLTRCQLHTFRINYGLLLTVCANKAFVELGSWQCTNWKVNRWK